MEYTYKNTYPSQRDAFVALSAETEEEYLKNSNIDLPTITPNMNIKVVVVQNGNERNGFAEVDVITTITNNV